MVYDIFNLADLGTGNLGGIDQSVKILTYVFGQPITNLLNLPLSDIIQSSSANTTGSLLTGILGTFNNLLLMLAFVIYGYTVVVGTMNTARDGSFLGKMDSHWTPVRLILGPGLVLPIKGFSIIQYIVMWAILVGVNLGNGVWQSALQKATFTPPTALPQAVSTQVAKDVGSVFVYASVEQSIKALAKKAGLTTTNGQLSVGISGGSLNVFGTNAAAFQSKMTAACGNYAWTTLCQQAINEMFANQEDSLYYPASPIPSLTNGIPNGKNYDLTNVFIQLGSNNAALNSNADGSFTATYLFNTSNALGPAGSSTDMTAGWLANQLLDNNFISRTVISSAGVPANVSVQAMRDTASFAPFIHTIIQNATTNIGKADPTAGVSLLNAPIPGTGKTCQADGEQVGGTTTCKAAPTPVPYSNSWWYGSEVYLNLNQQMANNIKAVAQQIAQMNIQPGSIKLGGVKGVSCTSSTSGGSSSTTNDCIQPTVNATMAIAKYDLNGKMTSLTGMANLTGGSLKYQKLKQTITLDPISSSSLNIMFASWTNLICPFSPTLPIKNGQPQTCQDLAAANQQQVILSNNTGKSGWQDTGADPAFFSMLENMPQAYREPLSALLYLYLKKPTLYGANQAEQILTLKSIIQNIVAVLVSNSIYPGSEVASASVGTSSEISPVQRMVQQMFNSVVGARLPGNYSPVDGATPAAVNHNQIVGQIFNDIYSLGNQSFGSLQSVIGGSFNTIASAQRIGLQMISVVVGSVLSTSQYIQNTMQGFMHSDDKLVSNITKTAIGGEGAAAGLSIVGSIASAFGFGGGDSAAIVADLGTQIAVMVQQLNLQEKLVDQNYDMMMDLMWIPVGIMAATMLLVAGISFALVVPLIPYILFWAGQIAWLLGVIEAIIAAPLLALAIAHPGGHETWGHSVSGIRMLFGIVLRPVLMILGLLTGLILTFIVIKFSSQGFQVVSTEILSFSSQLGNYNMGPSGSPVGIQAIIGKNATITSGMLACLMLMLFCSFMVMAFNKCFSTIYLFPEKVVQWIGGQAASAGKEEMQQISGQASQAGQSAGQSGGQALGSQGQASAQQVQGQGGVGKSQGDAALQGGQSVRKSGGEAAKGLGKGDDTGEGGSVE